MTSFTANYADKSTGATVGKIGTMLRKMVGRFIQAHESQAALMTADYGSKIQSAEQLKRMARKFEASQPNLAAELRFIASRG